MVTMNPNIDYAFIVAVIVISVRSTITTAELQAQVLRWALGVGS